MSDLPEQVDQSVRSRGLLRRGQAVLVAVSGGLDSMVLLRALSELAPRRGWRLTVAHFNHCLRGRSSDADERLVVGAAKKLGLRCVVERADVRGYARASKLSIEMAARKLRHEFLARTAVRLRIGSVALAHHADDQVELFFLRLLRGSGGSGLAGMKWRNPSPANGRVQIVRPLLGQTRAVLRDYARSAKVRFREDASNARLDVRRNRIRHDLLPRLRREYQPALDRAVLRLMEIAGAEAECVGRMSARWLGSSRRQAFGELPLAVQRRCLQLQLLQRHVPSEFELVELLRTAPGRKIALSPDLAAMRTQEGEVRLVAAGSGGYFLPGGGEADDELEVVFGGCRGNLSFGGLGIEWRVGSHRGKRIPRPKFGREYFDAAEVGVKAVLRHWRAGDRFQPIGMPVPVKLQDLFTNARIPREERHRLVVLAAANGELVWVERLRISERFKLTGRTNRRLQWLWKRL